MRTVHLVVPDGVDDPARPSGGNVYDRRVSQELGILGWSVHEHVATGSWPVPAPGDRAVLRDILGSLPEDAVVLLDGLVASAAPAELAAQARRLRLVALVHMPLAEQAAEGPASGTGRRERAALAACATVLSTSAWTRRWLLDRYSVAAGRVHVAEPGVDPADLAAGSAGSSAGGNLLCVAAVTPEKGHEVLVAALAALDEVAQADWRCTCVGSLDQAPDHARRVRQQARDAGLEGRLVLAGARTGTELHAAYAAADLLVLPSRRETYGMVVAEALARGLPVLGTDVGGVAEALGRGSDGTLPGLLVPPDAPGPLAEAISAWLGDGALRRRWRRAAAERRAGLAGWPVTAGLVSRVLDGAAR